jgi:hypothetical protein
MDGSAGGRHGAGAPHAVVIGSGFGGLAAVVRLGAKGYRVTVLEKLDAPGGRAYVHRQDGFVLDAGPTVITAPQLFEELWQVAGRRLSDVAVVHDVRGLEGLAGCEAHARDPPPTRGDLGHGLPEPHVRARALRHLGQREREPAHPALDRPHAHCLDVGDDVERGRGEKRVGAAVRRVAREELNEARILEEAREGRPHRATRVHVEHRARPTDARRRDEARERRPLPFHERLADRGVDARRVARELAVGPCLARRREARDRVRAAIPRRRRGRATCRPARNAARAPRAAAA